MHRLREIGPAVLSSALLLGLLSCGSSEKPDPEAHLPTIPITLPNGRVIRAEIATTPEEQKRGLMFRTKLAPDRGMIFVFPEPGNHPFWMYHTLIPLDIIWMDADRKIVFISANTPPCPSETPSDCPNYGGAERAQYVLELAGGVAASYGLKVGDRIQL